MNTQNLAKTSAILLIACGVLCPLSGKSAPFSETPTDFERYVNHGGFKESGQFDEFGSTPVEVRFYNPRECEQYKWISGEDKGRIIGYHCTFDFRVFSTLGTKVCTNYLIEYYYDDDIREEFSAPNGWKSLARSSSECSEWEKPQPLPEQPSTRNESDITSTNQSSNLVLPNYAVIGGSTFFFLLGGALGFVIARRKK